MRDRDFYALLATHHTETKIGFGWVWRRRDVVTVNDVYHRSNQWLDPVCSSQIDTSVLIPRTLAEKVARPCKPCWGET